MLLYLTLAAAAIFQESLCMDFQAILDGRRPTSTLPPATRPGTCVPKSTLDYQSLITVPSPPLEIQALVVSGPSSNRVDLVFFSDGYVAEEQQKFIEDAKRLATDISGNQTFNTVKPLLNFWAAFTPSKESGIGVGGVPKDTVYGLYRDGTELRGVYYDKPEVAHAACSSMGVQCDYPILLGNDPYYGGLGGEFTVITSSFANGPLVLRHELGHSIIEVGEEYDGGFAYFGPNAATDLSQPIPWAHWLSEPPSSDAAPRVERSVMPLQEYAWTLLNATAPWSAKFTSSGTFSRHVVRFSLSGLPESSDLAVELDGRNLGWVPRAFIGFDRWHYDIHVNETLAGGEHKVQFALLNARREGVAQLCSVEIIEYGNEDEFIPTPGHYSLYPTYSDKNETSYRPTNEDCLMRVVTSPDFCSACTEGLWLSLLRRVSLVDGIQGACEHRAGAWLQTIDLALVPLAQFRTAAAAAAAGRVRESYTITWRKDGRVLAEFANRTRLELAGDAAVGTYAARVAFTTDEVRVDADGLLSADAAYTVTEHCGSSLGS